MEISKESAIKKLQVGIENTLFDGYFTEALATICLMLSNRPDPIGQNYRRVLFDHARTLRSNSEFLVNLGEKNVGGDNKSAYRNRNNNHNIYSFIFLC